MDAEGELREQDGDDDDEADDEDDGAAADDVEDKGDSNSCPMLSPFYMPSSFMFFNSLNPDNNPTQ